jgi:hypothetical protein
VARPYSIKFGPGFKNLPSLLKRQQQSLKLGHRLRAVRKGELLPERWTVSLRAQVPSRPSPRQQSLDRDRGPEVRPVQSRQRFALS